MPANESKATLRVVDDMLTPLTWGKASIRIVHASPDLEKVDVFVKDNDEKLFNSVDPQTVTSYNEVDPKRPRSSSDRKTILLTVPNMTFEPGQHYTIVIAGKTKDTPKLETIKIYVKLNIATVTPVVSPSPTATMKR